MRIPAFLVDHPGEALIAAVLLVALIFVSINLVVDILYTIVDPRLSLSGGRAH